MLSLPLLSHLNINKLTKNKDWFVDWFDSPYYHILYKHRDYVEAQKFILNLNKYLKPKADSKLLDVACGKGRHSLFMAQLGFYVDGFDLSKNNISHAKKHENERLNFYINDIRQSLKTDFYDFAFNLFTSFGYFDNFKDNQKSINAISKSLKSGGKVILDFMNCNKVINNLTVSETKTIEDIEFNIKRKYSDGFIIKDIAFEAEGKTYKYQEKVNAISLTEFKNYFSNANLNIETIFGDYNLNKFDIENSNRLILIASKN